MMQLVQLFSTHPHSVIGNNKDDLLMLAGNLYRNEADARAVFYAMDTCILHKRKKRHFRNKQLLKRFLYRNLILQLIGKAIFLNFKKAFNQLDFLSDGDKASFPGNRLSKYLRHIL